MENISTLDYNGMINASVTMTMVIMARDGIQNATRNAGMEIRVYLAVEVGETAFTKWTLTRLPWTLILVINGV